MFQQIVYVHCQYVIKSDVKFFKISHGRKLLHEKILPCVIIHTIGFFGQPPRSSFNCGFFGSGLSGLIPFHGFAPKAVVEILGGFFLQLFHKGVLAHLL